jgi:hypothetical protein
MKARIIAGAAVVGLALASLSAHAQPMRASMLASRLGGRDARARHAERFVAEVTVLYANNSHRGIDKRIGNMPELKRPPFSSYDSYELLSRTRMPIHKGQARILRLPNGRVLRTKLIDVLPRDFVRLSASINQPHGSTFLPLLEVKAKVGQAFIVAGQSYKNGILVLVIRVTR